MDEHAENMRLLKFIREDPAWALSRVKRAAELEASAATQRGVVPDNEHWWCRECGAFDGPTGDEHQCDINHAPGTP